MPAGYECFKGQYIDNPVEFRLTRLEANDLQHQLKNEGADIRVCKSDTQPAWEKHMREYEVRFQGNNEQFFSLLKFFTTATGELSKAMSCVYRTRRQIRVMLPFKFTEELKKTCSQWGLRYLESKSIQSLLNERVNGRIHNVNNDNDAIRFVYNVTGRIVRREMNR